MPHDLYAELRQLGPVLWHPRTYVPAFGSDIEFWAVIGNREVEQANRDWETFSAYDDTTLVPFPPERRGVMIVAKDPPEHLKLRKLISFLTEVIMRAADPGRGVTPQERNDAQAALFGYAHRLSGEKRANPTDDVWSILATGELDEFELDLFFMVLTFAGSETTRNVLTQGLIALVDNTGQLDDLRQDRSLLPSATEEILRWSSPAVCFARTVTRDVELGGRIICRERSTCTPPMPMLRP